MIWARDPAVRLYSARQQQQSIVVACLRSSLSLRFSLLCKSLDFTSYRCHPARGPSKKKNTISEKTVASHPNQEQL